MNLLYHQNNTGFELPVDDDDDSDFSLAAAAAAGGGGGGKGGKKKKKKAPAPPLPYTNMWVVCCFPPRRPSGWHRDLSGRPS